MQAKRQAPALIRLILVSVCLLFLNGCLFGLFSNVKKFFSAEDIATARQRNPDNTTIEITDLRIPQKGERVSIVDPLSRQKIEVTFGHTYHAASGKLCSLYNESNENNADTQRHSGLACLNQNRFWEKVPLQINLNNKPKHEP